MNTATLPILVVDDDSFQRRMIRIKLQTRGYEVNEAKDGIEALEFLEQQKYSAVLLDIVMPQLNGWEVLDQIRGRRSIADLPVIMMTARDNEYDIDAALARGATDYLTKPIDFGALDRRIDSCIAAPAAAGAIDETPADDSIADDTHRDLLPKVAEQSLAMLDSLLGNLPAVVFRAVGDGRGNIHLSYQSDGLQTFLGQSWKSAQEIIASTDNKSRHNLNGQFRAKGRLLLPLYARFKVSLTGGATGWVECRANPHRLPSGETVWDAILIDCSNQVSSTGENAIPDRDQTTRDASYRDAEGFVHQCTRCRKVRDFSPTGGWKHVDEWVRQMPLQTSHTICEACAESTALTTAD